MLDVLLQILFHVVLLATLVVTCWDNRSSKGVRRLTDEEDAPKDKGTTWAHGTWKYAEPEAKPEHIWDKETRPPLGLLHLKADNSALFRAQRKVANYKPNGIYHVYWDDFGLQGVYDLLMDFVNMPSYQSSYMYGSPVAWFRRVNVTLIMHDLPTPDEVVRRRAVVFGSLKPVELRGGRGGSRFMITSQDPKVVLTRASLRTTFMQRLEDMGPEKAAELMKDFKRWRKEGREDFFLCIPKMRMSDMIFPTKDYEKEEKNERNRHNIKKEKPPKEDKKPEVKCMLIDELKPVDIFYGDLKEQRYERVVYVYFYENRIKITNWEYPMWMLQEELKQDEPLDELQKYDAEKHRQFDDD